MAQTERVANISTTPTTTTTNLPCLSSAAKSEYARYRRHLSAMMHEQILGKHREGWEEDARGCMAVVIGPLYAANLVKTP